MALDDTNTKDRWKSDATTGHLEDNFLRLEGNSASFDPSQQQAAALMQAQYNGAFVSQPVGRIGITVVQAKLAKNYGFTKMDPYCRLRLGHAVLETPTAYNGSKNPRWNKTFACVCPPGVDAIFIEIYDECSLTSDARIAWGCVAVSERILSGETVDDWYPLTGQQGDDKEGMINLVLSYRLTQSQGFIPQQAPVLAIPGGATFTYPNLPAMVVPGGGPIPLGTSQQAQPDQPSSQIQLPPTYTEDDFNQVKEMFPAMDDEVIRSVLEANGGNKDHSINALLQMTVES